MTAYLRVTNYEKYQHYKDRRPVWVKFYVDTLSDAELNALPIPTRLVAHLLLLLAGNRDNHIPNDHIWIAIECNVSRPQAKRALAELQACRYLIPASEYASAAASRTASKNASESDSASCAPARALETEKEVRAKALTPKPKKTREPDPLWDALTAELGEPATASERGRRNKALKELRDANATPADITARCRFYRQHWPNVDLTATALAANWSSLTGTTNGATATIGQPGYKPTTEGERDLHQRLLHRNA